MHDACTCMCVCVWKEISEKEGLIRPGLRLDVFRKKESHICPDLHMGRPNILSNKLQPVSIPSGTSQHLRLSKHSSGTSCSSSPVFLIFIHFESDVPLTLSGLSYLHPLQPFLSGVSLPQFHFASKFALCRVLMCWPYTRTSPCIKTP